MTAKTKKFNDNLPLQFRLRCSRELNLELGRYDAVIEVTEVAVRNFLSEAQSYQLLNKYIRLKGEIINVNVQHLKAEIFKTRLSYSYIASTYQYFESFLYKWVEEYELLYDVKLEFGDSNHDYLKKVLEQVQKHQRLHNNNECIIEDAIGKDITEVIRYYKAVRNKFSHFYQIKNERVEKAFRELMKYQNNLEEKFNVRASKFEECSFNDFLLFTRSIRFFNRRISNYIKPKRDEVLFNYIKKNSQFQKIRQNKKRLDNSWKNFLMIEFGVSKNDADRIVSLA